jgi:hypothetical protein
MELALVRKDSTLAALAAEVELMCVILDGRLVVFNPDIGRGHNA